MSLTIGVEVVVAYAKRLMVAASMYWKTKAIQF